MQLPMPYIPYWFETLAPCFSWVVPTIAFSGMWLSRSTHDRSFQLIAERAYYAAMLIVAAASLRTIMTNEGCWLLHMFSIGIMALGATIPHPTVESESNEYAHDYPNTQTDVAWFD
jgi:hypothetical protein